VIVHAGITLGRSKRLISQPYTLLIALSCCSEFIAAPHGHIAPLAKDFIPCHSELGVQMGV
jgi:hypothetical protein